MPWSWSALPISNTPPICTIKAVISFIPNPLVAAGLKSCGKPGPSSEIERTHSLGVICKRTVILPFAYLIEFVMSSLAMNPSGIAVTVGILKLRSLHDEGSF